MNAPYLVATTTTRPSRQAAIILVSIDNFLSLSLKLLSRSFVLSLFSFQEDQEWPINPAEMTTKRYQTDPKTIPR